MATDQYVTDRAGRQGHHVAALEGGELQDHVLPVAVDVHVTGAGAAVDVAVGEQLAADRPGHGLAAGNGEGHEHYERVVRAPGELAQSALGQRRPAVASETIVRDTRVLNWKGGHWRSPPSASSPPISGSLRSASRMAVIAAQSAGACSAVSVTAPSRWVRTISRPRRSQCRSTISFAVPLSSVISSIVSTRHPVAARRRRAARASSVIVGVVISDLLSWVSGGPGCAPGRFCVPPTPAGVGHAA